jgi:hypothetical protein
MGASTAPLHAAIGCDFSGSRLLLQALGFRLVGAAYDPIFCRPIRIADRIDPAVLSGI